MMEIASVTWKRMVPVKGLSAEKAYAELEKLRATCPDQKLTDDAIVEAAKSKRHMLHPWFVWDDTEAAIEYRRMQARQLLRSFEVTYVDTPEIKTRAYEVSVKRSGDPEKRTEYSTTVDVLSGEESRDRLIASAIREAMAFRRRFQHLHELDAVIEAINKTLEALAG